MMKASGFKRILPAVAVLSSLVCGGVPAGAKVLDQTKKVAGVTVQYKVVLPDGYDPAKSYPAIIAFGGGPQTMNTVDGIVTRNFRAEAEKRGYIVMALAAPDGELFFEGGERIVRNLRLRRRDGTDERALPRVRLADERARMPRGEFA